ncbi:TniB family NTP-binding protein [Rhizobium tumorigenes]|uniref:TniB family NTP-binding protein n=1 Tax=Rhizobium tumorigenes TaxID=2041385 RepID=A0AAF1KL61_9HYPH|nr:TniB family NTP-binding protein [Rhizobium tumorigenes]WFR97593.1 TniB family NTP-binding protein [Rhizobium tumorigenes]WFS03195.1 TniB family NTP-binding protein [Rhizobium tumorigenes]
MTDDEDPTDFYRIKIHTTAFRTPRERADAAALPEPVRIDMVEHLVYEYPRFLAGMKMIGRFHMRNAKLGITGVGSIGGLIGEFRTGKSCLIQNYLRKFPSYDGEGQKYYPSIYLRATGDWDAKSAAREILTMTGRPPRSNISVADINNAALERMAKVKTRLLVIDDAHEPINKGGTAAASFFSLIKGFGDKRIGNVFLVGPRSVRMAISGRKEIKGRGFPHATVKSFDPTSAKGKEFYAMFLMAVDERLPFLRLSGLSRKPFYDDLLDYSDGSIPLTMNLVRPAAYAAIEAGADRIETHHMRQALFDLEGKSVEPDEDDNDNEGYV